MNISGYEWSSLTEEDAERLRDRLRLLSELSQNPMWQVFQHQMEQARDAADNKLKGAKDAWEAAQALGAFKTASDLASWLSREASTTRDVLEAAMKLQRERGSSNNAATPSPGATSGAGAQP